MWIRDGEEVVAALRRDSEGKNGGWADWMVAIRRNGNGSWEVVTRWGRTGASPQSKVTACESEETARRLATIAASAKFRDSRYRALTGVVSTPNILKRRVSGAWTVDEWLRVHGLLVRHQLVQPYPRDPLCSSTEFVISTACTPKTLAPIRAALSSPDVVVYYGDPPIDDTQAIGLACCLAMAFGNDTKGFLGEAITARERFLELSTAIEEYPSVVSLARDIGLLPTAVDYASIAMSRASPWAAIV